MRQDEYSCSIRALQHYMYCPHRWGLIYNDCSWAENYFVTKANLLHQRVHDPDRSYISRKKKVLTSVTVFNDGLNLYGITDCIEIERGSAFPALKGNKTQEGAASDPEELPRLTIVEYKPRKPARAEYNQDDLMQVFAQKVCIDWMFGCRAEGVLYYANVKQRVRLPLEEQYAELYADLTFLLAEIRRYIKNGKVPPMRKKQNCRGCSFLNLCMPKANQKQADSLFRQLEEMYK